MAEDKKRRAVLIKDRAWFSEMVEGEDGVFIELEWDDSLSPEGQKQATFYNHYKRGELVILEQLENGKWRKVENE
jgi:hypothetical protein